MYFSFHKKLKFEKMSKYMKLFYFRRFDTIAIAGARGLSLFGESDINNLTKGAFLC